MEVEGLDDLLKFTYELGKKGARIENKAINAGAEIIADEMRSKVKVSKVNEVHIQDDIEISKVKNSGVEKNVDIGPGEKTNWRAKFLEYGTSKMEAIPFIEVSLHEKRKEAVDVTIKTMKDGLGL